MISAEGTTSKGVWINQRSTKRNDWTDARLVVEAWEAEADGAVVAADSAHPPVVVLEEGLPTPIHTAIQDFTAVKKRNGTDDSRMAQYRAVLDTRLVAFANSKNILYVEEMDNA